MVEFDGCHIMVDDGTVLATLPMLAGETQSPLRSQVEFRVDLLFLGVQIATHEECQLDQTSVSMLHDDGSRVHIIECKPAMICFTCRRADITCTQSDGTVMDMRRERVQRKHRLSRAAASFGSKYEVLARMLRSYRSAIADKEDELIHLYEVRDSLSSAFGSKSNALRKLEMPESDWKRLGQLCNDLPLRQGRHRGCVKQPIRDASDEELKEARCLAVSFIELYINYLARI